MAIQIKKATREQLKLRMAIDGPTGSGKTYTALRFAFSLASDPSKVGVIDTENRSASKYVGEAPDNFPWAFDVVELESFHPQSYIEAIAAFETAGYEVLVIDSLSHAWDGAEGLLEQHDKSTRKNGGNSWTAWRDVTPFHNKLIQAILQSKMHVIVTMRSKMEYAQIKDEKTGRTSVEKLGMAPVQRAGMEYEFDIVCDIDWSHNLLVSKTRCSVVDGKVEHKPGPLFIQPIRAWLNTGERPTPEPSPTAKPEVTTEVITGPNGERLAKITYAHWQDDPVLVASFKAEAKKLGLDKEATLHALGDVAKASDYPGSYEEAIAALRAAVTKSSDTEPEDGLVDAALQLGAKVVEVVGASV